MSERAPINTKKYNKNYESFDKILDKIDDENHCCMLLCNLLGNRLRLLASESSDYKQPIDEFITTLPMRVGSIYRHRF